MRREYEAARRAFDEWQRVCCPQEQRTFNRGLAELKQRTRYQIQERLDPTGPVVGPIVDGFRPLAFDPKDLNDQAAVVQQECLARCSEAIGEIYRGFNTAVVRLLADTMARLGEGLRPEFAPDLAGRADGQDGDPPAIAFGTALTCSSMRSRPPGMSCTAEGPGR